MVHPGEAADLPVAGRQQAQEGVSQRAAQRLRGEPRHQDVCQATERAPTFHRVYRWVDLDPVVETRATDKV